MSEAEFIFRSMNTHQVLIILVVDTRVLGCVADSLQERRFASISPTDYKDTKASIYDANAPYERARQISEEDALFRLSFSITNSTDKLINDNLKKIGTSTYHAFMEGPHAPLPEPPLRDEHGAKRDRGRATKTC
jgi:hypothetical protein